MECDESLTNNEVEVNPFHQSLVRQMIQAGNNDENKKITNEALVATGEVIRQFVQEAWHRASIEAECEYEGVVDNRTNAGECDASKASVIGDQTNGTTAPIRADHITKIAAELLMDFS